MLESRVLVDLLAIIIPILLHWCQGEFCSPWLIHALVDEDTTLGVAGTNLAHGKHSTTPVPMAGVTQVLDVPGELDAGEDDIILVFTASNRCPMIETPPPLR